jgi:serine/threonine-protein kinase
MIESGMRARRQKLAAGSVPPDAWGRVGSVIAERLRLTRVIGAGPHGTVYEAEDLTDGRAVAVKVLHARTDANASALAGAREVRMAAAFGHPNLVELESLGRLDDGAMYMVSELVPGIDLGRVAGEGAVSERRALAFLRDALRGVEPAHRADTAHGDLKPENLIIAGIGVVDDELRDVAEPVRVVDGALARLFRQGMASAVARAGGPFVAPEVASTGVPTIRGDVYALGAVLADLLGMDVARLEIRSVTPETGFVLWRATQRDARDRFRDATEMLRSVEVALRALE